MAEQVKTIIECLAKEPFLKTFNIISFDSLEPLQLLQVLNDVFAYVDPKHKMDLREELPEDMARRMLKFLSVLKFQPECSIQEFQAGVITGEKGIVYSVLVWILPKIEALKKRAYLGKFLVKVDVPAEILQDQEVESTYNAYNELVEEFKEVHRSTDTLKNNQYTAADIKKDIQQMEQEYEQIQKTIERKKARVAQIQNHEELLAGARSLRREQERQASITEQRLGQKSAMAAADSKILRLQQQLRDIKAATQNMSVEKLMIKLEEENRSTQYLVDEKLPKEIASKKKVCSSLQKVLLEPAMNDDDIDELQETAQELQNELNELHHERMSKADPVDDKLSMFRKQAMMISRKKDALAEELKEHTNEWTSSEASLKDKKEQMKRMGASEVLRGEEFRQYTMMLRNRGNVYKSKRAEIADLRAEIGVLARTESILSNQFNTIKETIANTEKEKGISGYTDAQDELEKVSAQKGATDEQKGAVLEDMSGMSNKLHTAIADKKATLAPIIKELRPLRSKCQELEARHADKKSEYDSVSASIGSNLSSLEQEVKGMRELAQSEESRYHFIMHSKQLLELQQQKVDEELAIYKSTDPAARKSSLREQYNRKILEQDNLGKALRAKQKAVREQHAPNLAQMLMWKDLQSLLAFKRDTIIMRQQSQDQEREEAQGENMLIL